MIGYGWLGRVDMDAEIDGVAFDPGMPTRREEFLFVRNIAVMLGPGVCVDAGTGVTPHQHVMPPILSANGWMVYAVDKDERTLKMPAYDNVVRLQEDMTRTSLRDGIADMVCCVSVLEHCDPTVRQEFAREARRLLRSGGYLVVTADEIEPRELAGLFSNGFAIGKEKEQEDGFRHLSPRVGCVVARRV